MQVLKLSDTLLAVIKNDVVLEECGYARINTDVLKKLIKKGLDLQNSDVASVVNDVISYAADYAHMIDFTEHRGNEITIHSTFNVYDKAETKAREQKFEAFRNSQLKKSNGCPELEVWEQV